MLQSLPTWTPCPARTIGHHPISRRDAASSKPTGCPWPSWRVLPGFSASPLTRVRLFWVGADRISFNLQACGPLGFLIPNLIDEETEAQRGSQLPEA